MLHSEGLGTIQDEMKDPAKWRVLCERAGVERDPDKVSELAREINLLLDEKRGLLTSSQAIKKARPKTRDSLHFGKSLSGKLSCFFNLCGSTFYARAELDRDQATDDLLAKFDSHECTGKMDDFR